MELNNELDRLGKYSDIDRELTRAKKLHPDYPDNIFEQLAIMQEEAGEVTKAILDFSCGKDTIQHIREELVQTAAMCVRMLENLPEEKKTGHKFSGLYKEYAIFEDQLRRIPK